MSILGPDGKQITLYERPDWGDNSILSQGTWGTKAKYMYYYIRSVD